MFKASLRELRFLLVWVGQCADPGIAGVGWDSGELLLKCGLTAIWKSGMEIKQTRAVALVVISAPEPEHPGDKKSSDAVSVSKVITV